MTAEPNRASADLHRILDQLPSNGVLALGEPTHGSANVSAWKFEIIHGLAERGLLAMLAFEDPYVTGLAVDEALRGEGDIDEAWDRGSSIWDTTTIREGMRRLQRINSSCAMQGRTRYLGFDIRKPKVAAAMLVEAGHHDRALVAMATGATLSESEVEQLIAVCSQVVTCGKGTESDVADQILRHVDVYLVEPDLSRLRRRDTHMAELLLGYLPSTGVTVVWAHNEHVARNPDNFGGPSMGTVLDRALDDRYVPLGILCGDGRCRAVDPASGSDDYQSVPLPPVRQHTTEAALRSDGRGFVTGAEFSHPGPRRFIGWSVDTRLFETAPEEFEVARPSSDFSALVYLPASEADSTASRRST
ncbi:erythromycin esterase family protein [Brachybacterium epidermidis]|uniref:erythromycin esterase family protein n=1 Tax=Brachybacterium epidermidis TaxID=2781983 RepID=UPI00398ECAD7